MYMFT